MMLVPSWGSSFSARNIQVIYPSWQHVFLYACLEHVIISAILYVYIGAFISGRADTNTPRVPFRRASHLPACLAVSLRQKIPPFVIPAVRSKGPFVAPADREGSKLLNNFRSWFPEILQLTHGEMNLEALWKKIEKTYGCVYRYF